MKAVKMFNSIKSGTKMYVSNYGKALAGSIDRLDLAVHTMMILMGFSLGISYAIITFNISIENLKAIIDLNISALMLDLAVAFSMFVVLLMAVFTAMRNDEEVIK